MKRTFLLFVSVFLINILFAQNANKTRYIKGNIQDKERAVTDAAKAGDYSLITDAIDFCISSRDFLGDDRDIDELLITSLNLLQNQNISGLKVDDIAEKLTLLFKTYNNDDVKSVIIKTIASYPSTASISLVNAYVSEQMQARSEMTPLILSAVETLKSSGNSNSFNVLFIADLLDVWPEYSAVIADAYGTLAETSEKEILHILSTIPTDMKLILLEKISANPKISGKIRGEVAENALSMSINNVEEKNEKDSDAIKLEYNALKIIGGTKWTRAAKLVTDYFPSARKAFEEGKLTENQFADVIKCMTIVASTDTSSVLASYLNYLNKCTEENQTASKVVVLSVINSLGDLGDKTAFDYLLYVTYLDYPEEVSAAARVSLTKLKW